MVTPYNYDRRIFAAIKPTVEGFLFFLRALAIQADEAQQKRDKAKGQHPNPYALGLVLKAVQSIEDKMRSALRSSDHEDLVDLKTHILRQFTHSNVRTQAIKAIDAYITTGRAPNYPKGTSARPYWR